MYVDDETKKSQVSRSRSQLQINRSCLRGVGEVLTRRASGNMYLHTDKPVGAGVVTSTLEHAVCHTGIGGGSRGWINVSNFKRSFLPIFTPWEVELCGIRSDHKISDSYP